MDINRANQKIGLYGKCYRFLNNTMLLDMVNTQVLDIQLTRELAGILIAKPVQNDYLRHLNIT